MSVNSPAKLQRVERHLIRQRGAGVRSIAASFGFSIGLDSNSSQQPNGTATARYGPPAKRRKTIVEPQPNETIENDEHATPTKASAAVETEKQTERDVQRTATKSRPVVKVRKRFQVDDATASSGTGDDSFVFGQRKEKKKSRTREEAIFAIALEKEAIVEEPAKEASPVKSRPKRRAATNATAKVTDGFLEEAAPVDKKRRDASPVKKARTVRKRGAVQQVETAEVDVHEQAVVAATAPEVTKQTGRARKTAAKPTTSVKNKASEPLRNACMSDEEDVLLQPEMPTEPKGKKRATRKPPTKKNVTTRAKPHEDLEAPEPPKAVKKTSRKRKADVEDDFDASRATKRGRTQATDDSEPTTQVLGPVEQAEGISQRRDPTVQSGKQPKSRRQKAGTNSAVPMTAAIADILGEQSSAATAIDAQPSTRDDTGWTSSRRPQEAKPSQRRPLLETDVNLTMRSNSPEKPGSRSKSQPLPRVADKAVSEGKPSPRRRREDARPSDMDADLKMRSSSSEHTVPHPIPRDADKAVPGNRLKPRRLSGEAKPSRRRPINETSADFVRSKSTEMPETVQRRHPSTSDTEAPPVIAPPPRPPTSKAKTHPTSKQRQITQEENDNPPTAPSASEKTSRNEARRHDRSRQVPTIDTAALEADPPAAPTIARISPNADNRAMTRIALPASRDAHQQNRRGGAVSNGQSLKSGADLASESAVQTIAENLVPAAGEKPKRGRKAVAAIDRDHESEMSGNKVQNFLKNGEEDVDWLFDAPDAMRPEKAAEVKKTAVNGRANTKGRTKMVDIDLDDLISNIASFAQHEREASVSTAAKQPSTAKSRSRRKV
ncbi:uncharacterized protein LTR77_010889 [Saxophila tyrrhenica]|uniref:Uncharacterized protein n=1 Tax=Saxophila tyrrhenica TaxID=1690608 RepID=A0AAV9NUJ4_9PEZI|nr:hypothetical protein LTR77_010889 [Saxophila tyrrhenica]